jgi:PAS domain S-box-containing protein
MAVTSHITDFSEREQRYRDIVENASDLILAVDLEDRITSVNAAFERTLGYARDEVIGRPLACIVAPAWRGQLRDATAVKLRRSSKATLYDVEFIANDGSAVQVEVSSWLVVEDGRPVGVQAICRDVSDRRDAEHTLLQRAFEETDVGMFVALPSGRIERANVAFCRMLGYTAFELRRLDVVEISHPDDRADTSASLVQLVDGKLSRYRREKRYVCKNGDVVRVQIGVSPVTDATGAVVSLIAQAVDVTARRESEARFRRLFESSPQGIAVVSHEGRVLQANPALGQILGYATEELEGLAFTDFTHPDDCASDVELYTKLMAGELAHYEIEKRFIRKDGGLVWGHVTVFALADSGNGPRLAIGILGDVTERRALEEQLRQSQRMEAIGQLAGGVAHDFNNLLTAVTSYCDLATDALADGGEPLLQASVDGIRSAADRGAEVTRQLLAFSRRQVLELTPLDLNAAVSDQVRFLRRLLGEDVEIRLALDPEVASVTMDPGQLTQVVMNLAVNARDAMADGGVLTIETHNVELDGAPTMTGILSGSYVLLAVSDTGCGMDGPTRSRIFEPFFTTKELGKGTGLGLPTVLGIVEQSGGRVSVYSEPRIGTTFKVYMPSGGSKLSTATAPVAATTATRPSGSGTILLVEDNDAVRRPLTRLLADLGYDVLAADGPEEAIAHAHGRTIDLLVTDVVMPGMNGRLLSEKLVAAQPSMRVLFMSGYTDDAVIARGVIEPGTAFLQKPFGADRLAQKIRELLDA